MRRPVLLVGAAVLLLGLGPACEPASGPASEPGSGAPDRDGSAWLLTRKAGETGLDLVLRSGADPSTEILEVKGGGLALIDYDRDGDSDVFVPNGAWLDRVEDGPGARMFRNDGGLRFTDVTAALGIRHRRWSFGVAVGDCDGDGFDDIFVACLGRDVLLRNVEGRRFDDVSSRAGLDREGWSTGCALADLDDDGDLDLYVARYLRFDPRRPPPPSTFKSTRVFGGPIGLPPEPDSLLENLGDGRFVDRTEASGCGAVAPSHGLNVVVLDVDRDGRLDILVGNDSRASFLFLGRGELSFKERGIASGFAANGDGVFQATMGIAIGDVNDDRWPDVFTTNFSGDTNTLHVGAPGALFDDRTRALGLAQDSMPFVGWATAFVDIDHDGDEDLVVFNGHVYPQATLASMDSPYEQTPLLYLRDGPRFARAAAAEAGAWLDEPHRDRTAVVGDLDRDGDLDVIVGELNRPLRLLEGRAADRRPGSSIVVVPRDERPGRAASLAGALVELDGPGGTQRRFLIAGGPFQSVSEPIAHFGVGAGPDSDDERDSGDGSEAWTVRVRWVDGHEQVLEGVRRGARVVVRRSG